MKRILIKLSGEQFGGESGKGIDTDVIQLLAEDIKKNQRQTRCGNRNCSGRGKFRPWGRAAQKRKSDFGKYGSLHGDACNHDELHGSKRYSRKFWSDVSHVVET